MRDDIVAQVRQALSNIKDALVEVGVLPELIAEISDPIRDQQARVPGCRPRNRAGYREVLGLEYGIAMSAVPVAALKEDGAKAEIQVTVVVPN